MSGVSQTYGATRALRDVSMTVRTGQVHGLVGRNGAGKSTLLRMITGLEVPDAGELRFFDRPAPAASDRAGWQEQVACVYQRPSVFANLTVAENLFAGRLPGGRSVSWRRMLTEADRILTEWSIDVDPRQLLSEVPLEERQLIQIAKALDAGTRIVLLDEPTVQLEGSAIRRLFDKVQQLQQTGVTFVFVSHFLRELLAVCDSATVLRDGQVLWSRTGADVRGDDLVEALLAGQEQRRHQAAAVQSGVRSGEAAGDLAEDPAGVPGGEPAPAAGLSVQGLTDRAGAFADVTFEVAPGELVSVGGLGSSGKYALGEALAGLRPLASGTVAVSGRPLRAGSVPAAQRAGIGYVPADRHRDGYVPLLDVAENMTMSVMGDLAPRGLFSPRRQRERAERLIEEVALVPADPGLAVANLSGGNQQKVVLARALATRPRVLVLVSPTAGVDISAKDAIYALVLSSLSEGVAVVCISDDVEELLIGRRVLVMREGRLQQELSEPTEEQLVRAIEGVE